MANEATLGGLSDLDVARWNTEIRIKAAAVAIHPQFFEGKNAVNEAHTASFNVWDNISANATTRLLSSEVADPANVAVTQSKVSITSYEYGAVVARSQALQSVGIIDAEKSLIELIRINLGRTLDNAAALRTYSAMTTWANGTIAGPMTPDVITAVVADLEDNGVPRNGGTYTAIISPLTKRDVFSSEDLKGYIPLGKYADPTGVFNYEMGAYLGVRWVVGSSAYHATSEEVRHDYPLFFGANAFGQANGYDPEVVFSILDALKRCLQIGWKAMRGYGPVDVGNVRQLDILPTALG
jgi:N4-gp56 family major capsid protein